MKSLVLVRVQQDLAQGGAKSKTGRRCRMVWMSLAEGPTCADLLVVQVTEKSLQGCADLQRYCSALEVKCQPLLDYELLHKVA